MTMTLLLAALAMGFFGSPHCLGMCGGIVAAFGISMRDLSPSKRRALIITYHIGRLISYMMLGVIASLIGSQVIAPFLTDNALPRILLGGALIFAALLMLGVPVLNRLEKLGLGLWNRLSPIRQKVLPINSLPKAMGAGMLWGLLPCGLVYGALVMAVSTAATQVDALSGAVFMLFFGLGTLPMLIATDSMIAFLQKMVAKFNLRQFSGVLMLISGLSVALSPAIMHAMHGHDHTAHAHHSTHDHTSHHGTRDHATHSEHNHHSPDHNHSDHSHSTHTNHTDTHSHH
ncbi:sulfite exporter TauE/SafE family protein [Moraxella nasibovis]|uniref:sulfite exporter TauE/SafE family protein n=1 Tax=Moraxella nasibovis TaxID=2904120 RepID=UPI00240F3DC8|nr:sulfite exporter TauE/SafE family protein [Moraxella nasibovis]WFF38251.1 sulfite exporter TauE/SafE family protein [Moraxella nasibovis]